MNIIGIVAEYNPFHNGHLYHIKKVKEMYPDSTIIIILGGHFMQRGESSIINKWDKADIALNYGADIVMELPFPFATQSADIFAKGSIQILKYLKADTIVFGSESNDVKKLEEMARIQIDNDKYQELVKKELDNGINYPTALSNSLKALTNNEINSPNDILGVSYIREIIRENANIKPVTIKRTNDYHSNDIKTDIASASAIRKSLKDKNEIIKLVPDITYKYLNKENFFIEDYFNLLKYQIMININNLDKFQTVDEGIENRIKKYIYESESLEDLISKIKTKRYTYNKIRRMFTHIMCNFTKEEALKFKNITYLRILGFNSNGQKYLNKIKKDLNIPLITKFNKNRNDEMLELELRITSVYASILPEDKKRILIEKEYKSSPIIFKD
jgi:predicted nucleotidyltransferase